MSVLLPYVVGLGVFLQTYSLFLYCLCCFYSENGHRPPLNTAAGEFSLRVFQQSKPTVNFPPKTLLQLLVEYRLSPQNLLISILAQDRLMWSALH